MRCKYNLLGIDPAGVCPECSLPIRTSIRVSRNRARWTVFPIGVCLTLVLAPILVSGFEYLHREAVIRAGYTSMPDWFYRVYFVVWLTYFFMAGVAEAVSGHLRYVPFFCRFVIFVAMIGSIFPIATHAIAIMLP